MQNSIKMYALLGSKKMPKILILREVILGSSVSYRVYVRSKLFVQYHQDIICLFHRVDICTDKSAKAIVN